MPIITVPDATYRRLADQAAAIGATVEQIIVPLLEQAAPAEPSPEQRRAAFEALIQLVRSHAGHYPPEHVLDVGRDAMYDDRLRSQL